MKPRKKTKLCLQCNGVNPISASHCAYCGALLAMEEVEKPQEPFSSSGASQDLFAQGASSFTPVSQVNLTPYHVGTATQGFVQDRQPTLVEEKLDKPLYSVFDQPQIHQMGGLKDDVKVDSNLASNMTPPKKEKGGASSWQKGFSFLSDLLPKSKEASQEDQESSLNLSSALSAGALAAGTSLIAISLLTFVFSQEGKIVLSWSEQTAAWIMLISVGLIVFGWKTSRQDD